MTAKLKTKEHNGTSAQHRSIFSGRALAVFGVTFSFVVMAISGAMLFFAPRGRTAQQIDWHLGGLGRHGWEGIHLTTSVLFIIFVLWHFLVHLGFYRTTLRGTKFHPTGHRIEAAIALILILVLTSMAVVELPPANWIIDLNEYYKKEYWELAN